MIQKVLVIIAIVVAASYVGYIFYKKFFSKKEECESCAVGKAAEK